jgi:hypothetical protein
VAADFAGVCVAAAVVVDVNAVVVDVNAVVDVVWDGGVTDKCAADSC